MRVIAAFFGPYAPDALTAHVAVFARDFKRFEQLTKLATSSMIARRVESLCCLRIRISQNCPKPPRISYYHGTMACASMLRLTIASDYGG